MFSKFYLAVISFLVGIVSVEVLNLNWVTPVFILLISSIISIFLYIKKENSAKYIFVICALFSIGCLRMSLAQTDGDINLVNKVGESVVLEGQIISEPDIRDTSARYVLRLENFEYNILVVANRFPIFNYGDVIKVSGKLDLPKNFVTDNGGEFDYISYLSKDNIYFIIYQPKIERLGEGGNIIFKNIYRLKNYFVSNVSRVVSEPNSSFISGLIFGSRQSIGEELLTKMKNVGLIHIVAISGYNVTIIASAILYCSSYFGRRKLGLGISILGIVGFAVMVGLGSTVIRASIMAFIALLAKYLGRQSEALRALGVAVVLMLIWNPTLLLRDPSFQLSTMATLGLILFSPIISKYLKSVPEKFGFREIVSSTFAVQIFLLPMLIKMSGIFSPVSFIVNLIVLPIIPTAMLLGFITGVSGIFGTIISWPFGALSYLITQIIIKIVDVSSTIPFAYVQLGLLPNWLILIWYGIYAYIFYKSKALWVSPERS